MSLRQKVKLEYEVDGKDQQVTAEYSAIDLRAWEGEFGESSLGTPMSISMLTWLGHHAAVRTGQLDGELKDYTKFDQACVSVEGVRDERPPTKAAKKAATRKAAGDDSSAP